MLHALLADRDVRRDPFVVDEPAEELTGSVGGVGSKPLRLQREAPLGAMSSIIEMVRYGSKADLTASRLCVR
jgi:hypothetical protein